ncbi:MAG: RbsD/FucU domain-containing protein [Alkalibacterium sp.]|nr:RbsD/FucU domain-containing protein [Alkalibacterium sp.]
MLTVILKGLQVEKYLLAEEIKKENNPQQLKEIEKIMGKVQMDWLSHEEMKEQSNKVKAIIRTGEATLYSNIILQAGVIF